MITCVFTSTHSLPELLDWLHDLSLDSYAQQFVKEELYLDVLVDVTEKTLEKMSVATGHRLKIMKAIKELKGTIKYEGVNWINCLHLCCRGQEYRVWWIRCWPSSK